MLKTNETAVEKANEKLREQAWKLENLALDMINDAYVDLGYYMAQKAAGNLSEEEIREDTKKYEAITEHIKATIAFFESNNTTDE